MNKDTPVGFDSLKLYQQAYTGAGKDLSVLAWSAANCTYRGGYGTAWTDGSGVNEENAWTGRMRAGIAWTGLGLEDEIHGLGLRSGSATARPGCL
jgi:hypothetical protein